MQHTLTPYSEHYCLDLFLTGNKQEELWSNQAKAVDFFDLKQYVMSVLQHMKFDLNAIEVNEGTLPHFDYSTVYMIDGQEIVTFGKLSKKTLKQFDVKKDVFYATFNWTMMLQSIAKAAEIQFVALPKFPSVRRDLAMIFDKNVNFDEVKKVAMKAENKILQSMSLFDVYEGEKIPEGKKQYAMSFVLMSTTTTLTDKVIEKTMSKIQGALEQQLNAVLR